MKNRLKLKICGLGSEESYRRVIPFLPDFVGFIFYRKSPRFVGEDHEWIRGIDPDDNTRKIGVFVNEEVEAIRSICTKAGIGMVQLHGHEPREQCQELMSSGFKVIKVFQIGQDFSFDQVKVFEGAADYFLFDTGGKYFGGNGLPFDWSLLSHYDLPQPFFLSGGIGSENIKDVGFLNHDGLFAVDVNSRLESSPGLKDPELLGKFMEAFKEIRYD